MKKAVSIFVVMVLAIVMVGCAAGKPNLKKIYENECDSSWATLASDGSYLSIDTNPFDIEDYIDYDAYSAIQTINEELKLPQSLLEKMGATRALDGRQSETYDHVTVSWSYHPDDGLEIMYEVR